MKEKLTNFNSLLWRRFSQIKLHCNYNQAAVALGQLLFGQTSARPTSNP